MQLKIPNLTQHTLCTQLLIHQCFFRLSSSFFLLPPLLRELCRLSTVLPYTLSLWLDLATNLFRPSVVTWVLLASNRVRFFTLNGRDCKSMQLTIY